MLVVARAALSRCTAVVAQLARDQFMIGTAKRFNFLVSRGFAVKARDEDRYRDPKDLKKIRRYLNRRWRASEDEPEPRLTDLDALIEAARSYEPLIGPRARHQPPQSRSAHEKFSQLLKRVYRTYIARDVLKVFEVFLQADQPTTKHFNLALSALKELHPVRAEHLEQGQRYLQEMDQRGVQPNHKTFEYLLKLTIVHRRPDIAERFIRKMMEEYDLEVDVTCWELLAKSHAVAHFEEGLRSTLNRMTKYLGVPPSPATRHLLLQLLIETGRGGLAFLELERLLRLGVPPPPETFPLLLKNLAQEGETQPILDFFQLLEEYDIKPDTACYNQLLQAHIKQANLNAAQQLFDTMLDKGPTPNGESYGLMVAAHGQQDDMNSVMRLVTAMGQKGVPLTPSIYHTLMHMAARRKDYQAVLDLFEKMRHERVAVDATSYAVGLEALQSGASPAQLHRFLLRMHQCHVVPIALPLFRRCLQALRAWGDPHPSSTLLHNILQEKNLNKKVLFCLARNCSQEGDIAGLLLLQQQLTDRHIPIDTPFRNLLLIAFLANGRLSDVEELLSQILSEGPNALTRDAFNQLMFAYRASNNLTGAWRLYVELESGDHFRRLWSFNALIELLCQHDRPRDALQLLDRMEKLSIQPNEKTFSFLSDAMNRQQDEEGLELLQHKRNRIPLNPSMHDEPESAVQETESAETNTSESHTDSVEWWLKDVPHNKST